MWCRVGKIELIGEGAYKRAVHDDSDSGGNSLFTTAFGA